VGLGLTSSALSTTLSPLPKNRDKSHRRGSNAEDDDVGDGGDGDGDAGVTHGDADVECVVVGPLLRRFQVVERLHDDEHIVDTFKKL